MSIISVLMLSSCVSNPIVSNSASNNESIVPLLNIQTINFEERQTISWGVQKLKELQNVEIKGTKKVKVAIVDSGIDKKHKDFDNKIVKEFNAISPAEPIVDILGHGTAVASIIAAADNGIGLLGISPDVEIYSVKVLDENGNAQVEDLVNAIDWCIKNEVNVINLSIGISKDKVSLKNVIERAIRSNIIIVASAGNTYSSKVDYPAAYEKVISVSAIDENGKVPTFASLGKVDFFAPGVNVLTFSKDNGYMLNQGTSLAAAHVTGLIANIIQSPDYYKLNEVSYDSVYNALSGLAQPLKSKQLNVGLLK